MRGPGDTEPTIPDEPDLPVPNDPGDSEPILIKRRGYTDPDDPQPK